MLHSIHTCILCVKTDVNLNCRCFVSHWTIMHGQDENCLRALLYVWEEQTHRKYYTWRTIIKSLKELGAVRLANALAQRTACWLLTTILYYSYNGMCRHNTHNQYWEIVKVLWLLIVNKINFLISYRTINSYGVSKFSSFQRCDECCYCMCVCMCACNLIALWRGNHPHYAPMHRLPSLPLTWTINCSLLVGVVSTPFPHCY